MPPTDSKTLPKPLPDPPRPISPAMQTYASQRKDWQLGCLGILALLTGIVLLILNPEIGNIEALAIISIVVGAGLLGYGRLHNQGKSKRIRATLVNGSVVTAQVIEVNRYFGRNGSSVSILLEVEGTRLKIAPNEESLVKCFPEGETVSVIWWAEQPKLVVPVDALMKLDAGDADAVKGEI